MLHVDLYHNYAQFLFLFTVLTPKDPDSDPNTCQNVKSDSDPQQNLLEPDQLS